jgi:hypothetical protein
MGPRLVKFALGIVFLVAAAGVGILYSLDKPASAEVNDCVSGDREHELRIVECEDPSATYRVADRIDPASRAVADDPGTCRAYPTTTWVYWGTRYRSKGYVLCLEPVVH